MGGIYTRIEWLKHFDLKDEKAKLTREEENEIKAIRQENVSALSYSIMWLGMVSVVFALVANLFNWKDPENPNSLLAYIEVLLLASIVFLVAAGMLFWHGCSTDHTYRQYAQFNENGDSLVIVGFFILIVGLCFLCSYHLLRSRALNQIIELRLLCASCPLREMIVKAISLYSPLVFVGILFFVLNRITVVTKRRIVTCFIVEASRFPFYGAVHKNPEELIKILRDEKKKAGLMILLGIFVLILVVAYFCA